MLSERQKLVLIGIVEEYVKTSEPVGSRTLSKRPELAFSPATIRNDMADLEEMGYILKTHTSSGRIPSEEGYRYYVQEIMNRTKEIEVTFPMIDEIFERESITKEEAIKESMALVADLTNYASVVLGQSAQNSRIRKLQFVSLQDRYAIILMVTDLGHVESKKIIIPEGISIHEVEKVVKVLDEVLYDCLISEIDKRLEQCGDNEGLQEFIIYNDQLIKVFLNAFASMVSDKVFVAGQSNILMQPEFQNVDKIREILDVFENKELLRVIRADSNGITVKIGQENEVKAMKDCTVVTVPYSSKDGLKGVISILGPTRMEYDKVIPLLEYIAENLKKIV
jgi:heat-inducible transcriptional repressor